MLRFRAAGPVLMTLAGALLALSCTSAPPARQSVENPAPQVEATPSAAEAQAHREWETTARRTVDELLGQADALADEGRLDEALDCVDAATIKLFQRPPGYQPGPEYLEYLAEVLDQAQQLEDRLDAQNEVSDSDQVPLEVVDTDLLEKVAEEPAAAEAEPVTSDFPLVVNPDVNRFLKAFTRPGELQRRIQRGLERGGRFLDTIRERFASAGLPKDLAYLPIIESGFSTTARSRAGAHGMWQFIASTARRYGLHVGTLLDERRDPYLSTEAAVAHLADLYAEFDDWYLALAAYNSGAGNVRRAIRRAHSNDFWRIKRYLPRETRNYVPAFIASVMVAKNPSRYGFDPDPADPLAFDEIQVPDALDLQVLAQGLGVPAAELRELNPAIRYDLTPAGHTTTVRVPRGLGQKATEQLQSIPRAKWAPRFLHVVRRGESLYTIARRYGSSVSAILQANHLRRSLIRPGQHLIVPRGIRRAGRHHAVRADGPSYVVRAGDTLWDIARSAGVSVRSLATANGLSTRSTIRPGERLVLPGGRTSAAPRRQHSSRSSGNSYRVRRGDSLYDIAQRFGVSVNELKHTNGLRRNLIHPGQTLRIPESEHTVASTTRTGSDAGKTYRVRSGDTLFDIAQRFGVPVRDLKRANGLRGNLIHPGQRLTIPSASQRG